jgi:hypothetical protein
MCQGDGVRPHASPPPTNPGHRRPSGPATLPHPACDRRDQHNASRSRRLANDVLSNNVIRAQLVSVSGSSSPSAGSVARRSGTACRPSSSGLDHHSSACHSLPARSCATGELVRTCAQPRGRRQPLSQREAAARWPSTASCGTTTSAATASTSGHSTTERSAPSVDTDFGAMPIILAVACDGQLLGERQGMARLSCRAIAWRRYVSMVKSTELRDPGHARP